MSNSDEYRKIFVHVDKKAKHLKSLLTKIKLAKLIKLLKRYDELEERIDDMKQNSLNNLLLIFNIPEEEGEDLKQVLNDIFRKKLGFIVKDESFLHVGRSNHYARPGNVRPILIEFTEVRIKNFVSMNRNILKNLGMPLEECLTKKRRQLLKKVKTLFDARRVWTCDGKVIFKGFDDNLYYARNRIEYRTIQ